MSNARLTVDSNGFANLILTGQWDEQVERAIEAEDWTVLSLFHVDWPDYKPLAKYASRINWLRVPFGPDKSKGLSELSNLKVIQMHDSPKPSIDFRIFRELEELEAPWDKGHPEYLANAEVKKLITQGVSGVDMHWVSPMRSLESLIIKSGNVASLYGVGELSRLRKLILDDLKKCTNVNDIKRLSLLEELSVDAPSARLSDISWISSMESLQDLILDCGLDEINWEDVGRHPALRNLSVIAPDGYLKTDEEIIQVITASGGRLEKFIRRPTRVPIFDIYLSKD